MNIRQASNKDKEIIRKMVIKTDEYYYNNLPTFNQNVNRDRKRHQTEVETFVDRVNIEDFYILELNNKPIGTIMVWNNNGETTLINFYIEKTYRGKGYGKYLLNYVIDNLVDSYCVLSVYKENTKALEFYYKFGFEYIQTQKTEEGELLWLIYYKNKKEVEI